MGTSAQITRRDPFCQKLPWMAPRATWKIASAWGCWPRTWFVLLWLDLVWSLVDSRDIQTSDLKLRSKILSSLPDCCQHWKRSNPSTVAGEFVSTSLLRSLVGVCCWSSTPLWIGIRFGPFWPSMTTVEKKDQIVAWNGDPTNWLEYALRAQEVRNLIFKKGSHLQPLASGCKWLQVAACLGKWPQVAAWASGCKCYVAACPSSCFPSNSQNLKKQWFFIFHIFSRFECASCQVPRNDDILRDDS